MSTAQAANPEYIEAVANLKERLKEGDTIFAVDRSRGAYSFFHFSVRTTPLDPRGTLITLYLTNNICGLLGYRYSSVAGKDTIRLEDFSDVTRAVRRLGEVLYNNPQAFEAREI